MATSAHGLTAPFGGRMWSKLLLAVAVCSFWPITGQAQTHHPGGDVAVAGNSDVPVANLSLYEVRRLFLGETRYWKGNMPVVLILPPANCISNIGSLPETAGALHTKID